MKKLFLILPLALVLCFTVGCQDKEALAELEEFKAQAEIETQNKNFVRQFMEDMDKNSGLTDDLLELIADDFKMYIWGSFEPLNKEACNQFITMLYAAFPDFTHAMEDMIAEGDKVAARCIVTGTHEGELQGIPPTGNKIKYGALQLWTIKEGKIAELWLQGDILMMMNQLGMELKPKEEDK
jgi:steroid delta-isomerase-like uncharacterized protein